MLYIRNIPNSLIPVPSPPFAENLLNFTATTCGTNDITEYEKSLQLHRLQGFVRVCKLVLLVQCLLYGNGYCNGGAYHRVVAHSEETHHLHVRGN